MNIFTEKDKKRNVIMLIMLGIALFLVPFASNLGVRIYLTILLLMLFLNFIFIIKKIITRLIKR